MPLDATKVIRSQFCNDTYEVFLDENDYVECVIRFTNDKHIGEIIPWSEIPWQLREQYEQYINPISS